MQIRFPYNIKPTGLHYAFIVAAIIFTGLTWTVLYLFQSFNGFSTTQPLFYGLVQFALAAFFAGIMFYDYRKNRRETGHLSKWKVFGGLAITVVTLSPLFVQCYATDYDDVYLDGRKWYLFGSGMVGFYLLILSILTLSVRRN